MFTHSYSQFLLREKKEIIAITPEFAISIVGRKAYHGKTGRTENPPKNDSYSFHQIGSFNDRSIH